jgi:homoserine O-acetyltransferase
MSWANLAPRGRCGVGEGGVLIRSAVLRLDSLALEHGGVLEGVDLGFTLYGEPGLPLVVVLGGISSGRNITGETGEGWWQDLVGEGRAIDPRTSAVLGMDFLGGTGASTGATGPGFPAISTFDQARAVAAVLDHLGVARAHAIVGSSYGGMVALAFAARFGQRLDRQVVMSAAHESHPMATALRSLQRRAVRLGLETGRMEEGLAIARGIAMTTYRTAEEFADRFDAVPDRTPDGFCFPVEEYLEHHGAEFVRRFSPWSFLCLSESIDVHRVDPARISTPTTLVAVDRDALVPPWQMRTLAERLAGPVRSIEIRSIYGHDAFLKETRAVSDILRTSLGAGGDL